MTSYRTLLLAGAVVLGSTSAYAASGHSVNVLEGRTAQGALAPYALRGVASRNPRGYDYEPGGTWSRIPMQIRKRDITTEGNGNK